MSKAREFSFGIVGGSYVIAKIDLKGSILHKSKVFRQKNIRIPNALRASPLNQIDIRIDERPSTSLLQSGQQSFFKTLGFSLDNKSLPI